MMFYVKRFFKVSMIVFSLFLVCQSAFAASVSITDATISEVRDQVTRDYLGIGFNIVVSNDAVLILQKTSNDFMTNVFYGSRYNTYPAYRAQFNFVQQANTVYTTAELSIITNPNSSFEKSTPIYNDKNINQYIKHLKFAFNGGYLYGLTTDESVKDDTLLIKAVDPKSPCEAAGLIAGDKIYKINDIKVSDLSKEKIDDMFSGSNTISLTVKDSPRFKSDSILKTGYCTLNLTKQFVPGPMQKAKLAPVPQSNSTSRPVLGITVLDRESAIKNNYKFNGDKGVYVVQVSPNGAADKGGIKQGDIILKMDNTLINSIADINTAMTDKKVGGSMDVLILRVGIPMSMMTIIKFEEVSL
jgi:C-terminal processing protease CtpA/Prc